MTNKNKNQKLKYAVIEFLTMEQIAKQEICNCIANI